MAQLPHHRHSGPLAPQPARKNQVDSAQDEPHSYNILDQEHPEFAHQIMQSAATTSDDLREESYAKENPQIVNINLSAQIMPLPAIARRKSAKPDAIRRCGLLGLEIGHVRLRLGTD
jgi:hypothetical protein